MRSVCLLYCLSGLLSLVYQVVWFRLFADEFGSTNLTFVLVLCNFIGGLGVGALCSARITRGLMRFSRLQDEIRVYGLIEVVIAASMVLTIVATRVPADLWGAFPYKLVDGIYQPSLVYQASTLAIAVICVFVPCVLMGVTFPLLCHAFRDDGRFPSLLYGWNTLGACSGVLLSEFVLLPRLGHGRTLLAAMGVNVVLGLYFLVQGRRGTEPAVERPAAARAPASVVHPSVLLVCAILGGLAAGAIEGDAFKRLRFLGCAAEVAMSFISFWAIVAIFTASWTVRVLPRLPFAAVKGAAVASLVVYATLWHFAIPIRDELSVPRASGALAGLLALTGIFVLPTLYPIALLLPWVCNHIQTDRRHLGLAYGANTVAFCTGMVAFTWIAPLVNIFYSLKLVMVVLAVLVVLLALLATSRPVPAWKPGGALVALAAAVVFTPTRFDPTYFAPDEPPAVYPVRAMKSNAAHTTFIVERPEWDTLYFTHHAMSGTSPGAQLYMRLMVHFPLLAQPEPKTALLICFGVGNTASAIAAHEGIERLDAVDLNDRVFETAPEFAATNRDVVDDPRLELIHDDGRSFLSRTDRQYDLVTSEPPPPLHEGVYRLYSREYYETVRRHLTPRGMMTQWLPTWQMSPASVQLATTTFVESFDHVLLFTGQGENFILVGSKSPIDLALLERRLGEEGAVQRDLARIGIREPLDLFARIIQGDSTLRRIYGGQPTISDQRNDLAHLFLDAGDPAVVAYDPVTMLSDVDAEHLAVGPALRDNTTNLARLIAVVPDFPLTSLLSVAETSSGDVVHAGADWERVYGLREQALRAYRSGRMKQAATLMEEALAIVPDQPDLLIMAARQAMRQQAYDRALAHFARHARLLPEEPDGHFGVGAALAGTGRTSEAIPHLERAARIAPDRPVHHRKLGDVLAAEGRFAEAVTAYDRTLELTPDDELARERRAQAAGQR